MVVEGKGSQPSKPRASPVSRIAQISSLKRYADRDYALDLLHQLARAVAPLIAQYNFKVGLLCEMYPKNPSLLGLNVNHGQKILIRLRMPHNDRSFYPMSDLIGTFLHELTHNVHGPHDAQFYALLDELKAKFEAGGFLASDYVCEENRLGASYTPPWATAQSVRQKRLQALSKGIYKAESRRLGGKKVPPGQMRQAMLEAAERRLKDSKWCPVSAEELREVVDLTEEANPENETENETTKKEKNVASDTISGDDVHSVESSDDVIVIDACIGPNELAPPLEESSFPIGQPDSILMRPDSPVYFSGSPGRNFIGDELSYPRRKLVADLNFDRIIGQFAEGSVSPKTSSPAPESQKSESLMAQTHQTIAGQNQKIAAMVANQPHKESLPQASQTEIKPSLSNPSQIESISSQLSTPPPSAEASIFKSQDFSSSVPKKPSVAISPRSVPDKKSKKPKSNPKRRKPEPRPRKEVRCISFKELFE